MIYKDICTRKEYEVNGVKKVTWPKCGTLRTTDAGKEFIELFQNPDVTLYVFPKKDKPAQQPEQEDQSANGEWPPEENQ